MCHSKSVVISDSESNNLILRDVLIFIIFCFLSNQINNVIDIIIKVEILSKSDLKINDHRLNVSHLSVRTHFLVYLCSI